MQRRTVAIISFTALIVILFPMLMIVGSVDIPPSEVWATLTGGEVSREAWRVIVLETRIPSACTAAIASAALSVAGLLLQTTFDNPLAGPSILGVSTGSP